jgi:hypothetical protein
VFRRAAGAKAKYGPGSRACFEIDGWDDRTGTGWSVMVRGLIRDITEATDEQAEELRRLPLHPAAPGVRDHLLALSAKPGERPPLRRAGDRQTDALLAASGFSPTWAARPS